MANLLVNDNLYSNEIKGWAKWIKVKQNGRGKKVCKKSINFLEQWETSL